MDTHFKSPIDIVVVGGSRGGLEAVKTILESTTEDLDAAILIVLHSGPASPRLLDRIFSRHTKMRVSDALEG